MTKIIPEIAVSDMAASVEFYRSLGFVTDDGGIVDEYGTQWESLALEDANLWLIRQDIAVWLTPGHALGNGVTISCSVDDVDELYNRVMNSPLRASVTKEIETLWYGLREFKITDPNGYMLTFNMHVEQPQEEQAARRDAAADTADIAQAQETRQSPIEGATQPISVAYASGPRRDIDQVQDGDDYGIAPEPVLPERRDIDQVQPGTLDTGPLPTLDEDNDTTESTGPSPVTQDEMIPYEPADGTDTGRS